MATRQRTRTSYSWGKRAPNEQLSRCMERVEKARKDTLHPGFSRLAGTTAALVRETRNLVAVMEHCAQSGMSVRAKEQGDRPVEPDAILESVDAVNEAVGQLANCRQEDFSERYVVFKEALDALAILSGNARKAGIKTTGAARDPYSEFTA